MRLLTAIKYMTTIVSEFGKYRYNHIPMGMYVSGHTFQAKIDQLLVDIKGIKTYIDDILVLIKYRFSNHIEN